VSALIAGQVLEWCAKRLGVPEVQESAARCVLAVLACLGGLSVAACRRSADPRLTIHPLHPQMSKVVASNGRIHALLERFAAAGCPLACG